MVPLGTFCAVAYVVPHLPGPSPAENWAHRMALWQTPDRDNAVRKGSDAMETVNDRGTGHIDAELLERMARIARGFPGHTVSLDERSQAAPVLCIDGVHTDEIADGLFGQQQSDR